MRRWHLVLWFALLTLRTVLIGLSTNFIGYGLAGLTRRFLVYPTQAIWPTNLATIALNRAFHMETNGAANGWKISRMRWFLVSTNFVPQSGQLTILGQTCFSAMFVYFWLPNYLFQALSYFNWITWIDPENVHLAAITGSLGGLGLNPLPTCVSRSLRMRSMLTGLVSFDWNVVVSFVDPLINPFFSTLNFFIGALTTMPIIAALWYTNVWHTGYLPINSNGVFSNTGKRYNVSRIVDAHGLFNKTAYEAYSPAYLAAGNILLYGVCE